MFCLENKDIGTLRPGIVFRSAALTDPAIATDGVVAAVQQTRVLADPVRFAAELANFPAREAMEQTYRQLVSSESALLGYAEVLQTIIAEPDAPVLIHCTAGKDRTGLMQWVSTPQW